MSKSQAASQETIDEALVIYQRSGPTAAAQAVGVAKGTVCRWAKKAGVASGTPAIEAATLASVARRQLKAAEWREEMTEFLRNVSLRAAEVEWLLLNRDTVPSIEKVTAARKHAVSDLLLITGEATSRIGLSGDAEEHAAAVARLRDELAERRKLKAL